MKPRTHTFQITVRFDKKCTRAFALREIRDTIYGEFYTTQREESDPGLFRVRSIRRLSADRSKGGSK
jgi:hypothetical protein